MINIEPQVFTKVKNALPAGTSVKSVDDYSPTAFPTVCISEEDNYVIRSTSSSSRVENHCFVMYEVSVYTKGSGEKKNAKTLLSTIDATMEDMGFRRQSVANVPNGGHYRITARYVAIVGRDETIYRR